MIIYNLEEKAIILKSGDDVAVAKERLNINTVLEYCGRKIRVNRDIPLWHKIAVNAIQHGNPIRRYGQIIGFASCNIAVGDHVHDHNVDWKEFLREYEFANEAMPTEFYPESEMRTFMGFKRDDGRVGTRNYIAIVATSNCSASVSRYIADKFRNEVSKDYPNVDGVFAVTPKGGCSTRVDGEDVMQLQRVLAGFADHPNVGGYLLVGLGCEVNQADYLIANQGLLLGPEHRSGVILIQNCGGIQKAVDAGVKAVQKMLPYANEFRRTTQPVSDLILATECGGSDSNSGISGNPAVGVAADELVKYGGTVILGETTEMYGAEHLLTKRAKNEIVGQKLIERIRWWEHYAKTHDAEINNNPTPGNIAGGLSNIYEKSLGAIAKGGTTTINEVYRYAERVTEKGLVIMDTPGNDPASVTGVVAGGATIVVFTTGRGSVFGFKPTPSIKVATNSQLYHQMIDEMDINTGVVLDGATVTDVGLSIFEEIIEVASGKKTKSELSDVGEEEFSPWVLGPIL
ncbi:altronate dehydratase [Candidatus Poribacteria bacterium]|nr:altronate dehydratase [Candidatus Poribacteria bacterium]